MRRMYIVHSQIISLCAEYGRMSKSIW